MTEGRRYHVVSVLGQGSFGTVYRARAESSGGFTQTVALKLLRADKQQDADLARRLRDEARVLALIHHRAIVKVLGLTELQGSAGPPSWAVVMELVDGVDLRTLLGRGPVPARVAVAIAAEVASALHAAWVADGPDGAPLRLIHRDVKPSNLVLTAHGELKLLDFGIARTQGGHTDDATTYGTEAYMSPERRDYNDTPAGDVYGLGAVLFELVTGQMFGITFVREERHHEKLFQVLAFFPDDSPPAVLAVRQLVLDMLSFDAEQRPTAQDVRRRCLKLVSELAGPELVEWSEQVVPKLLETRTLPPDDLVGTTLLESPAAEPTAPTAVVVPPAPPEAPPAPPEQERLPTAVYVAWALLALTLVGGGAWAWRSYTAAAPPEAPERDLVEPRVEIVEDAPPPDARPPDAPPPDAAPSAERAPTTTGAITATSGAIASSAGNGERGSGTRAPRDAPPEAPPAPSRETGTLRVEGDAAAVEFRRADAVLRGGAATVGTWEVWADFGDGQRRAAGSASVRAGETTTVKCSAVQGRCIVRAGP